MTFNDMKTNVPRHLFNLNLVKLKIMKESTARKERKSTCAEKLRRTYGINNEKFIGIFGFDIN